jgi:hypothetical protein
LIAIKGDEMTEYEHKLKEGDRVEHVRAVDCYGTVKEVDTNLPDPTTVIVLWDDTPEDKDTQWSNKLNKVEGV